MVEKIVFLGMGGTIAGRAKDAGDNVGYRAGEVGVQSLLDGVAGLDQAIQGCGVVAEQVAQIDSKDITTSHWLALAQRIADYLAQPDVRAVVVTHGTDTLEETAYFLARVLPETLIRQKPVVLTCAMRPASSLVPDGPGNMLDAVAVALTPGACGVVAVCAGKVHSALHVRKIHPYRLDAFDSGDATPLAVVEEGRVRNLVPWGAWEVPGDAVGKPLELARLAQLPALRVEIITSHGASSGAIVRALCAYDDPQDGPLRGLVVASTGNGTIHRDLEAALLQARAQGVRVVRVTRCTQGQIVLSAASRAAGTALVNPQALESWGLPPVKARIALMLQLMA